VLVAAVAAVVVVGSFLVVSFFVRGELVFCFLVRSGAGSCNSGDCVKGGELRLGRVDLRPIASVTPPR
jgi:hypothetical protein